jgi:hypothetical protein
MFLFDLDAKAIIIVHGSFHKAEKYAMFWLNWKASLSKNVKLINILNPRINLNLT